MTGDRKGIYELRVAADLLHDAERVLWPMWYCETGLGEMRAEWGRKVRAILDEIRAFEKDTRQDG